MSFGRKSFAFQVIYNMNLLQDVVLAEFIDPLGICSHEGVCRRSLKDASEKTKVIECDECLNTMFLIHDILINGNDLLEMQVCQ